MDWSTCSPDIILLIFKYLDYKNLVTCLSVCKSWRNLVDYMGQVNNMWDKLGQEAIYNKGVTYKQKSLLSWRDLYFNSLLWQKYAHYKVVNVIKFDNINNIHVYKDNLIVVLDLAVEYYNVETLTKVRKKPYMLDCQESEHMTVVLTSKNNLTIKFKQNHLPFSAECYQYKLIDEYCFVIDTKNVLWVYNNYEGVFVRRALMRCYDRLGSILDINLYKNDVYILKQNGSILRAKGLELEVETVAKVPMLKLFNASVLSMFQKHSIVYNVPRKERSEFFNVVAISDSEMVLECPGLTCAMPHGDIMILGYDDGNIVICNPQQSAIVKNPYLQFNVKDIANHTMKDPAIRALDVYEAKGMHYLFATTNSALFKIIIAHDND
ncbi:uncharacterized protein [Battus philenor]|uniref:uncharacterized protein n=1 Tax=Battus philenor TaxID=42288 RepID=UPI0035CFF7E3